LCSSNHLRVYSCTSVRLITQFCGKFPRSVLGVPGVSDSIFLLYFTPNFCMWYCFGRSVNFKLCKNIIPWHYYNVVQTVKVCTVLHLTVIPIRSETVFVEISSDRHFFIHSSGKATIFHTRKTSGEMKALYSNLAITNDFFI
jgi:hypothetical protein